MNTRSEWYVMRTRHQHEKKIASYLKKLGIECYLPLVSKKRFWSDRIKFIDLPLFPGYIFVCFELLEHYNKIIRHPGAIAFIHKENKPASMKPVEIANLKLVVTQAREVYSDPDKNFPPGQEIIVSYGPLKGVRGTVAWVKNKERIFVRLPLLDRMISTELELTDVEKI